MVIIFYMAHPLPPPIFLLFLSFLPMVARMKFPKYKIDPTVPLVYTLQRLHTALKVQIL